MATVELRPLSFGELLDRTFSLYRKHFWVFVGIMAVPQVFIVAVTVLSPGFRTVAGASQPAGKVAATMVVGSAVAMLVMIIVYFAVYSVALGATTFAVSSLNLGRAIGVADAYRKMRGRLKSLFNVLSSAFLRIFGCAITIVLVPLAVLLPLWYAVAVPALLLENIKPSQALKRSRALTKGQRGRIFVIWVLVMIVTWVVALILQGPFWLAAVIAVSKNTPAPPWLTLLMNISGSAAGAFTGPLLTIALVLLYYDVRVRKEGYDLQLMMAALDQTPAQPGPAAAIPPVPS